MIRVLYLGKHFFVALILYITTSDFQITKHWINREKNLVRFLNT